jgi:hypothetical protein
VRIEGARILEPLDVAFAAVSNPGCDAVDLHVRQVRLHVSRALRDGSDGTRSRDLRRDRTRERMGTSVKMIDRTYGHLAQDSEEAIRAPAPQPGSAARSRAEERARGERLVYGS